MSDNFFNPCPDNHTSGYFALGHYVIEGHSYKPVVSNLYLQINNFRAGEYYPFVITIYGRTNPTGRAVKTEAFVHYKYDHIHYYSLYMN